MPLPPRLPLLTSLHATSRIFTTLSTRRISPHLTHRCPPRPPLKLASRSHSHHGHSHSHGPDPFLTSRDTTDPGVRITRIGLLINLLMALSKGIGGYIFSSQALLADAFHALTDMVSDIMTLATVSTALSPPTESYPNGYGKIESLGSLGVSGLLLIGGLAMGYTSLLHLLSDLAPDIAAMLPHTHSHHHHGIPNLNAAWLAGGSVLVKEWLYRKTMKIAREKKSSVLASNAVHHRVDSLTAIVALAAIAGANMFPESAGWLDPVGGLVVAGMVVQAGAGNTAAALEELADRGVADEVRTEVREVVGKALESGEVLADVTGIKSGQNYILSITVAVDGGRSLLELKNAERRVRAAVGAGVKGAWRVAVRFVVTGETAESEFVKAVEAKKRQ